jgi:hypothetical protein
MDFLKYIEHSAENLQFYMWFKDYVQRFESLPEREKMLSPEWTQAQEEAEIAAYRSHRKQKSLSTEAHQILKSQELEPAKLSSGLETDPEKQDPFRDAHKNSSDKSSVDTDSTRRPTTGMQSMRTAYSKTAESAFDDAGCKFQPCMFDVWLILGALLIRMKSLFNLIVRRCPASSPSTLPTELLASLICLPESALLYCTL